MVFEEEPPDWGSVFAAASQLLRLRSRGRLRRVRKKLRRSVTASWTCIRTGAAPAPKDELTCATTRTRPNARRTTAMNVGIAAIHCALCRHRSPHN